MPPRRFSGVIVAFALRDIGGEAGNRPRQREARQKFEYERADDNQRELPEGIQRGKALVGIREEPRAAAPQQRKIGDYLHGRRGLAGQ